MRIIGIDASSKSTGYSIFEDGKLIDYGVIKDNGDDWRKRCFNMGDELRKVMDKYAPIDFAYCEDVPLKAGANTVLKMLSFLQGVICGMAISKGIYINLIPVTSWRSKLGLFDGTEKGKERGEMKRKSIEYVNREFGLNLKFVSKSSSKNDDDVADAILVAYSQIKPIDKPVKKSIGRKAKV